MSATTFIYALFDADGVIDYIGKSNDPKRRFREHRCRGFVLGVAPSSNWKCYEVFFIERFLELGGCLRNKNLGGGGPTRHTPESRAKISAGQKGRKFSSETRGKIGAAHVGKPLLPETLIKMRVARKKYLAKRAKLNFPSA